MTKFIDSTKKEEVKKNPTEFVKFICGDMTTNSITGTPSDWENVELISSYDYGFDIMIDYDNDKSDCVHFLGHWNDGC